MTTSSFSFAALLTRPDNLYWAWLKYQHYLQSTHVWTDECELACFEANLQAELDAIATCFRELSYRLTSLRLLPLPYSSSDDTDAKPKSIFHVAVRDQVAWIAFLNVVGPWLDRQMPAWSYGGRLYRSTWETEQNGMSSVKIGGYRHSAGYLYRRSEDAWALYQRHVFLTARAMAGSLHPDALDDAERKVLEQERCVDDRHKLSYLLDDYWATSGHPDVYRAQLAFDLDTSGFHLSAVLNNLSRFSSDFQKEIHQLASCLLDFQLDQRDLNQSALEHVCFSDNKTTLRYLPGGLAVEGFLKNVALMAVDQQISMRRDPDAAVFPCLTPSDLDIAHFRFSDDHFFLAPDFSALMHWVKTYQALCDAEQCGIRLNLKSVAPRALTDALVSTFQNRKVCQTSDKEVENARNAALLDKTYPLPVMTRTLRLLSNLTDMDFDLLQQQEKSHYIDEMESLLLGSHVGTAINQDVQIDRVARKLAWAVPQEILGNQANLCRIERRLFEERMHLSALRQRHEKLLEESVDARSIRTQIDQAQQNIARLDQQHHAISAANRQKQHKKRMHIFLMLLRALREHLDKRNLWVYLLQYCQFSGHDDLAPVHHELLQLHHIDPVKAAYVRALVCQIMANQAVQCAINMSHRDHLIYRRQAAYSYLKALLNQPVRLPEDTAPTFYERQALHLMQCGFGSALHYLRQVESELTTEEDVLSMQQLAAQCGAIDWISQPAQWAAKTSVPLSVWMWWAESRLNAPQRTTSGPIWKAAVSHLGLDEPCTWPLLSKYPREVIQAVGMETMVAACRSKEIFTRKQYAGWLHQLFQGMNLSRYEQQRGNAITANEQNVLLIMRRSRDRWLTLDQWIRWIRLRYRENAFDPRVTEWTALEIMDHVTEKGKVWLQGGSRKTYPLHPLNILIPHQWVHDKTQLLTWEHWKERIRRKPSILRLRESGWVEDFRYRFDLSPEMLPGHEIGMIRGLGLLLLGLVSHSLEWPAIWNVRGHEWQYVPIVRGRMRNVPFSSWTHAILVACLLPRQLETAQQDAAFMCLFDDDTTLDPPGIENLEQFQSCIRKARQVLEGYQMTLQQHVPRQLIPVKLEHFTHPDWEKDFGV
jgi:hypothetical protein